MRGHPARSPALLAFEVDGGQHPGRRHPFLEQGYGLLFALAAGEAKEPVQRKPLQDVKAALAGLPKVTV
mgnify:CR=1 FL=1